MGWKLHVHDKGNTKFFLLQLKQAGELKSGIIKKGLLTSRMYTHARITNLNGTINFPFGLRSGNSMNLTCVLCFYTSEPGAVADYNPTISTMVLGA